MAEVQVTSRQQTVLDGLKANKTPQDIAAGMNISVNGVYGHIRRLRKAGLIAGKTKAPSNRRRQRATTRKRASTRNASSQNGRVPAEAKAIKKAIAAGEKRVESINDEIARLESEKNAILATIPAGK